VERTVFSWGKVCSLVILVMMMVSVSNLAAAQEQDMSMSGMQIPMQMQMEDAAAKLPSPHAGSGTAWEPASVPEHEWMLMRGGWELMAHGVIFTDYNQQGGPRGEGKAESVNWGMVMEQHKLGKGTIMFRQMFSAESLTSPHPGFPELFQTGETYHGEPLVDHQHPHNVFAELSALYMLPLTKKISWELYGGPSAEPALGPVTYIHRTSASELPLAPLGHHLEDSTHTSFGVVTTGLVIERVKLEACAFNGHEPNEERWSIQPAALDSWSTRVSIAPARDWAAQYSIGHLDHPEALEAWNQWRQTASVEYNHPLAAGNWATSFVWGRVHEIGTGINLNGYLLESTLNFLRRDYVFTRMELVDKNELFPPAEQPSYRIGAYTFGGTRSGAESRLATGLGCGCDGLLKAGCAGCGVRKFSGVVPDISADASWIARRRASSLAEIVVPWQVLAGKKPDRLS
jgi:hypothetical protein